MAFLCYFIMPFSLLVLCQIRAGANDVCYTFKMFVPKPATWSFTCLVNAILQWISFNRMLLCGAKVHFFLSLWHSVSLTNCQCSTFCFHSLSIGFLSLLTCSHWQCTFPSWVQLLQSWLGSPYSVLHTLLDCISPPRYNHRHLPDLFLHHLWYVDSDYTWSWVASPIYGDEFSGLSIHFLKF